MRTNTWLGIITLNQAAQTFQNEELRKRDIARDAAFAKAHAAAQQGQFAMWIQTPDGQRFERWSHHALEVSRAIDDRQAAWDLAWELDVLERQEAAREEARAELEATTPEVPGDQKKNLRGCGFIMAALALVLGAVWIFLVVTAPETAPGESSLTAGSVVAFFLAVGAGLLALLGFLASGSDTARSSKIDRDVEAAVDQNVVIEEFPWHANPDEGFLDERQYRIAKTVETAAEKFPRAGKLLHLKGIYNTRPAQADEKDAPESIQRLLVAFREQDQERLAVLERERFG